MKYHDYLFYGVNIQSESIAARILSDPRVPSWHGDIVNMLRDRRDLATKRLTAEYGFDWPRQPLGATFLFPDVSRLHDRLPDHYRDAGPPGDAVARYLMEVRKVAVMPGSSYSANSENYIRMVTYGPEAVFADALDRLCLSL
jgi:phosphonopyruvate decarboxylase